MAAVDDSRARQARVHKLIESGESVAVDASFVPTAAAAAAATQAALARDGAAAGHERQHSGSSKKQNSRSPSSSRNRGSGSANAAAAPAPPDPTGGVALRFEKQELPISSFSGRSQPSSLAQQLNVVRSGLDDNFPRSASMKIFKYTVYLPHDEGAMVQIAVLANCTAHELVKEALRMALEENGGELPSGLINDAYSYRVHVAEEDGEVDTDFPVLGVNVNVASLGVESFVLRDRVDAAQRPAAGSVAEGPGEDHSRSHRGQGGSGGKHFALETDDQQPEEAAACGGCGNKCSIM